MSICLVHQNINDCPYIKMTCIFCNARINHLTNGIFCKNCKLEYMFNWQGNIHFLKAIDYSNDEVSFRYTRFLGFSKETDYVRLDIFNPKSLIIEPIFFKNWNNIWSLFKIKQKISTLLIFN